MDRLRPPVAQAAVAAACTVFLALAAGGLASRAGRQRPLPRASTPPPPPAPAPSAVPATANPAPQPPAARGVPGALLGAARTARPTPLLPAPGAGPPLRVLAGGVWLPVSGRRDGFLQVLTPCEVLGWVPAGAVDLERPAVRRASRLADATLVLDPGHGGSQTGTRGPAGLEEKDVNLDVALRLRAVLEAGPVLAGRRYPPPARVVLTRDRDTDAGLGYRAALANALAADAMLSVHSNADPDGPSPKPGTETYFQVRSPASRRLAGLAYEELVAALAAHAGVPWVADRDAGAKYRLGRGGLDYYGLLRRSRVPAIIAEVAFLSNPAEEQLLRQDRVRQELAEALARAVVRYLETSDPGSGFVEPYPRPPGPRGVLPPSCADPAP